MDIESGFPRQRLSYKAKTTKWRHQCVDWASKSSYFNCSPVRKSVVNMQINYDLVNGKIHMQDVAAILNPGNLISSFIPDKVQHYPIINSKIQMLRGEENARVFDWNIVVTNPNAVSEIEENKRNAMNTAIQGIVEDQSIDEETAAQQLQQVKEEYMRNWQDAREIRANRVVKHYSKQQNFKLMFNEGFVDALTAGMEVYLCDIVGGDPVVQRLNPMKLRAYRSGYSNCIEDADVLIYEDYWSPAKIIDVYYDDLTPKDISWLSDEIQDMGTGGGYDEDDRHGFIKASFIGEEGIDITGEPAASELFDALETYDGGFGSDLLPYDIEGNVLVMRVWWKSRRKILKVKSYDPMTGQEVFDFYPETYVVDEAAGEESEVMWINEEWEGTKIGNKIYARIRPCLVQYNSLTNPSRCHAGIIGTIYNINEARPLTFVDMMKPYNYLYDAVSAKLVDLIASNWGKLLELDLAFKPKKWEVDKWLWFARANKTLIKDSFNEADKGAATGKIAGGLNNASKGYIDADWGASIQNYINILDWIKQSMSDLVGINRQREGNTYSRETVGGIERSVLQSSYVTDWLFMKHEDTKKRVIEAFIEQAKAAFRGRTIKLQYICEDGSREPLIFEGDEFCECDYGLVADNSSDVQKLNSQLDSIAQAALQNSMLDLSTIVKLYRSSSLSEKAGLIEDAEKRMQQRQMQAQQQQQQAAQQIETMRQQTEAMKMQHEDSLNQRDNDTRIRVAEINAQAEYMRLGIYSEDNDPEIIGEKLDLERDKLKEQIREFDAELRQKDDEAEKKHKVELKKIEAQKQIAKSRPATTAKK